MRRNNFLLLLVILLAAFLRLWQLGVIPVGVTHDELGYIYNAYSIAKTSKNIFGEVLPIFTWINQGGWPFLPVPIYLSVPFFWIFDLTATVGRLPSAILGVFDVFLLYLLVKKIFNKQALALLSAFFLAISPWHLHFSRSAYDPNFALFFYLLGIVLFIWEIKREKLPLFALVSLFLAMYSYRAMNILFLPISIALVWYSLRVLRIQKRQLITFVIGSSVMVLSLFLSIFLNKGYAGEALSLQNPKMQEDIDAQIREAQGPLFIRRMFLNKPMYIIDTLRDNYVKSFSPEFLFVSTEPSKIYSIWSRGRVYFLDLLIIPLGIVYLFLINRRGGFFMIFMTLFGGLPGMFGLPMSARNFMLSAMLPVFVAGGVFALLHVVLPRVRTFLIVILILAYGYVLGSYLFDYYGRFALYAGEDWGKSLKDLSMTIQSEKEQYQKIMIGGSSLGDFLQYAFYTGIEPRVVQQVIREKKISTVGASFSLGRVEFIPGCLGHREDVPTYEGQKPALYFAHDDCHKMATPSGVIADYQRNTVWKIYRLYE